MLKTKGALTYDFSPLISASSFVLAAFLGRKGGISQSPYDSLNLCTRVGDKEENVEENKRTVGAAFNISPGNMVCVKQVHGDSIHLIDSEDKKGYEKVEADAIITNLKNVVIGILTADCVPVLIYDPVKRASGAAHAGWKSAALGIASKTVKAMTDEFGSKPSDMLAAIGPGIGVCCYDVNIDVENEFRKKYKDASLYITVPPFSKGRSGGINDGHLDLKGMNLLDLKQAGLKEKNISLSGICTSCKNDVFFSYRKDALITGRQMSFIAIKG
ncbi:MAG: peptidoglycan editing factor PgeF [Thermodesulfobacteriota bacterium]